MQNHNLDVEMGRAMALSEYNLDYTRFAADFDNLAQLAAKVAGTEVSMVNLLDTYHQWTIGRHGITGSITPREETVCQYTIRQAGPFEVKNMMADARFRNLDPVAGEEQLRYYYGIPITTPAGYHLGALCVMNKGEMQLAPGQTDLLHFVAREVVNRLDTLKQMEQLQSRAEQLAGSKRMLAHDIRGPVGGIIGLAELGSEEMVADAEPEVREYFNLISNSGKAVLQLAEEILEADRREATEDKDPSRYDLLCLKTTLLNLFTPRLIKKKLRLAVHFAPGNGREKIAKGYLLQILVNLIGNAIKFTPEQGRIDLTLALDPVPNPPQLRIRLSDTGMGMSGAQVAAILQGEGTSTSGTAGEAGFGLGLAVVKKLIDRQGGNWHITSVVGQGTVFTLSLQV